MLQEQKQAGAYQSAIKAVQSRIDIVLGKPEEVSRNGAAYYPHGCRGSRSHASNKKRHQENKSGYRVTTKKYLADPSQNCAQRPRQRFVYF
jgi:hypothetical protein